MPEGAVYVGRGSKWGNPNAIPKSLAPHLHDMARQHVVTAFEHYQLPALTEDAKRELRGKDLACWCRLDQTCHADLLLWVANELSPDSSAVAG